MINHNLTFVCDRCGNSLTVEELKTFPTTPKVYLPVGWYTVSVDNRSVHMCDDCSLELKTFMGEKGMSGINMLFSTELL